MKDQETKEPDGYIPETLGEFDPKKVHTRDPKTGRMMRINPYRVIIDNGVKYFEWPKGSNNLWWENKTFAGRLDDLGRPVRGKAHQKFIPPMTQDEAIGRANAVLKSENKRILAELASIKNEKELEKTHPKAKTKTVKSPKVEAKVVEADKGDKDVQPAAPKTGVSSKKLADS